VGEQRVARANVGGHVAGLARRRVALAQRVGAALLVVLEGGLVDQQAAPSLRGLGLDKKLLMPAHTRCTTQGCALRDSYDELTKKGVTVIGVSADDADTQKKFKEEYKFPFSLIADTDKKVMKAFGQAGLNMASREAYLIKDGKIVYHDTNQTGSQAKNILNFLSRESAAPATAPAPAAKPADAKPAAPAAK
jgi:hypothetical protein